MVVLYSLLWTLLCLLLQVTVFNQLHLFGGIALIYLLPLIKMPVQMNRPLQILLGFICGLTIDIFSNTPGMNALVCTLIMWLRLPILHMFIIADELKTGVPGALKIGLSPYLRYAFSIVTIYTIVLYLIESFTLFNIVPLILHILITTILTMAFAFALEVATLSK